MNTSASDPSVPQLVADVGGTNARFGLVLANATQSVSHIKSIAVSEHAQFVDAAGAYLQSLRTDHGLFAQPSRAAIAVATAVTDDWIQFTNSPWSFSRRTLSDELGLEALLVLNDFEALALSLPRLSGDQLRLMHAQAPTHGVKAVVGPGTGLGVGSVVPTASGWIALPGEGGHVTLAAADDFEVALLNAVRRSFPHVSAERLLSGTGLPTLYAGVCAVRGEMPAALTPKEIIERGLAQADPACADVVATFCAMLGGVCGNVALTLGAHGGVYIGGGIVPRLGEFFERSKFRERFEAKGRFQPYLRKIATPVIVDTFAALSGASLALAQSR